MRVGIPNRTDHLRRNPLEGLMMIPLLLSKGSVSCWGTRRGSCRGHVTPDDVKVMAKPVLRHRILLIPEAEVEGKTADDCINELLNSIEVPR